MRCSSIIIFFLLLVFVSGVSPELKASDEKADSITVLAKKRANRAAIMSAVVPGLGQIYNKKYWKLPLLYGGSAALIYFISLNNTEYKKFSKAIIYRNDDDSLTVDDYPRYTNDDLRVRKDYYRRNRDLCYILSGVLYSLNIIDAYVDSQLMNFDVSDDLSMVSGTTINYLSDGTPIPSFQLVLKFK